MTIVNTKVNTKVRTLTKVTQGSKLNPSPLIENSILTEDELNYILTEDESFYLIPE